MKHSTGRQADAQRADRDTAPVSLKDYLAAISVGCIEVRFASRHTKQLEHIENVLGAHRTRVAQLELERRQLLARMSTS